MKICLLALNLVTFPAPHGGPVVTLNADDVVTFVAPHHGFDPKVKCIVNMVDGKHIAVGVDCDEVRQRLQK